MSTQQQRQEWAALAAAATKGPLQSLAYTNAARAAVPQLLADVDALQSERDTLAAELERVRAQLVDEPEPMLYRASTRPLWTDDTQPNGKPQSTPDEDNAASARIKRMDELAEEWGMGGREIDAWPISIQDEYHRLVEAQNEYEATYC